MCLTEFDQDLYDNCRRREGYNEGIEAGREQGAQQKAIEDARNFKQNGVPIELIAKCVGLSIEEVASL